MHAFLYGVIVHKNKYAQNIWLPNYENEKFLSLDCHIQSKLTFKENVVFGTKLAFFKLSYSKSLLETTVTKGCQQKQNMVLF